MKKVDFVWWRLVLLLPFGNIVLLYSLFSGAVIWKILVGMLCGICFLLVNFSHPHTIDGSQKLASLSHGCMLLQLSRIWFCSEVLVAVAVAFTSCGIVIQLCNLGAFLVLYGFLLLNGILHIAFHAKQVKIPWYIALLLWWWVPILNWILVRHIAHTAQLEFQVERAKTELDAVRKENEICKTKYPILMVHGIFFRDWQYFNYWGRIPNELMRNGATIYYGNQQSAQSIENSAKELAAQIRIICETTGVEKVNIIAHSKGGLDCRCAMQEFGAAPYVASLTTINTPHHGCEFVDDLLQKMPNGLIRWVSNHYNKVFQKLGDANPDFLRGVQELMVQNCSAFHASHPCLPSVAYLAVMSKMHNVHAASFPLNLGYLLNRKHGGDNDGLVPVESARLENVPFAMVPETKKRGVSHGDMIDLMRENIADFDVREWYSQLVQQLKKNGF